MLLFLRRCASLALHHLRRARNRLILLLLWPVQVWFPDRYVRVLQWRGADFYPVRPHTSLVIAGSPGAANSYARVAFLHANPGLQVASHAHVWSEVAVAVALGLPVLLVLRAPLDAVASQLSRFQNVSLSRALRDYARFHEKVLPYRASVTVADFDEVTRAFGNVVHRVNDQHGTSFAVFDHTDEVAVTQVREAMAPLNGALPTSDRQSPGQAVRARLQARRYARLRGRCERAYHALLG